MSRRVTDEEAAEFRQACREILENTDIPEAWLSQLLGYSRASGLSMTLNERNNVKPSRDVHEKALKLLAGLHVREGHRAKA